ncbi:MAG: hypothetical protein LBV59_11700 [Sphingobacterium sp.]|jgi:hypothetical protein|uniref:hypothetical protein n=1 Tax=Sphingobacterium sp. TaxID=341027 RepID=UPI00283D1154|nr:hypothetical protein [Sphingobacterium sp.]MDR3008592.1 hypothetical protein [Sphingobacterium sp.]
MQEEPRFLIGENTYRINSLYGYISQAGNANNRLSFSDLVEHKHSYEMQVNAETGQLNPPDKQYTTVRIPKSILEGYAELSAFAESFNKNFSEKFGIQLIDQAVHEKMQNIEIPLPTLNLPTIKLGSFEYEIDVSLNELRQVDVPFNTVALNHLEIENGKYQVYTDKDGILADFDYLPNKHEFDQLVKLVPEDVAKVYGISVDQLPEKDSELRSHPDFVIERIENGHLPIIRIVDEDYYVDTRMEELRSCNAHFKKIMLEENSPRRFDEEDNRFVFLYDVLNRKVNMEYGLLTELPKNHVFIVLPDIVTLDPVAAGRKYCNDPTSLLNSYPLQTRMEARIVLPEKTFLPQLIRDNKLEQDKNNIKPKKKQEIPAKRKGLGL